jgi:hypothetical protein
MQVCLTLFSPPLFQLITLLLTSRGNNNWETNYSTLTKSNENASQSSKKQRECGESARDSLAYSCLLKNELLGTAIEDIKNVSDDKIGGYLSSSNRGLFKYQPPMRQVRRSTQIAK